MSKQIVKLLSSIQGSCDLPLSPYFQRDAMELVMVMLHWEKNENHYLKTFQEMLLSSVIK